MQNRISRWLLAAMLGFSLAARGASPVLAATQDYTRTYDTAANTIVYTIEPGAGDRVTISCNDVANSLMTQLTEPGQASEIAVRFVNNSDRTYVFDTCDFTTENYIDRDVPVASPGLPETPGYTIRTRPPQTEGALTDQRGFDGNLIPYSMTVLRSVTTPLKAVYGVQDSADVSVLQVLHLEDRLQSMGYDSYAGYLLDYYKTNCTDPTHTCRQATSLMELHPSHQCEILGSETFGYTGQSEIRQPRTISIQELQTDPAYYDFRVLGWGTRVTGPTGERRVEQDYEIMETDPEIIALGYRYLYAYGLYFSFDGTGIELPTSAEQLTRNNLELMNYMVKAPSVQGQLDVLKTLQLAPGQSITLPHVTLEVQLPNSYDMRAMDFGFSLSFTATGKAPDNTPSAPPDSQQTEQPGITASKPAETTTAEALAAPGSSADVPKTGDDGRLLRWLAVFAAASVLLVLVRRKMKREEKETP